MLKRNDTVIIKRGFWKGAEATVVQVINRGERYGVQPITAPGIPAKPFSLAASSVELVTK